MFKNGIFASVIHAPFATAWRRLRSNGARSIAIALLCCIAVAFFAQTLNRVYPISDWAIGSYLATWLKTGLFLASALSIGVVALDKLLGAPPKLMERLALGFSLGVVIFYLLLYFLGLLGLYSPVLFYALPLSLLGAAGPKIFVTWRRIRRRLGNAPLRWLAPQTLFEFATLAFLTICVVVVYVPLLVPNNVTYDAQWYHLTIGEDYASTGRIHPFPEGWFVGTYPQLASILYAWAFLGGGLLHERVLLCVHLEFLLLLGTLLSVSVLASRLVQRRLPFAAAGFFLFPGIFVYDACLGGGADHALAFFTPAVALTLLRFWRNASSREALLCGAMVAAAACTKYQACYLVAPAVLSVLAIGIWRRRFRSIALCGATVACISATHWLKNTLYYGDPFYPLMHDWLPTHPFHSDAAAWLRDNYWPSYAKPVGVGWTKVKNALWATLNFSFAPNGSFTWESKDLPLYGSLYTLLLPIALFLKRPGRLIWQIAAIQVGVSVWYLTSRQERFLQVLTPWIAATTVAILVRATERGRLAKLAMVPLVGLQLVWGSDLWALPRHAMNGRAPVQAAIEHFASAYDARKKTRFSFVQILEDLRPRPQLGEVPLIHLQRRKLGLGVHAISDEVGWQGGLNYLEHQAPKDTISLWRKMGVTHILWQRHRGFESPVDTARELVFLRALALVSTLEHHHAEWNYARLTGVGQQPSIAAQATQIAWLVCNSSPPPGLYSPRGLEHSMATRLLADPETISGAKVAIHAANAAAVSSACPLGTEARAILNEEFSRAGDLSGVELWVRARDSVR